MSTEKILRILLVDDEKIIRKTIGDYLKTLGHMVEEADNGKAALARSRDVTFDLALVDLKMPEMDGVSLLKEIRQVNPIIPVVIITGHATMEAAIEALRLGATDFLTKPIKLLELEAVLEKSIQITALRLDRQHLHETIRGIQGLYDVKTGERELIGESVAAQEIREKIAQVAESACDTILITGETGTGKEVVARQIHNTACSEGSPFLAVCCPAIPESLFESELFGCVKGSFTGSDRDKAGYFELAEGGTLFLDEISELSLSAQASLLRAAETRTIRRIGSPKEIHVHTGIIAATNADIQERMQAHLFRRDLYFRLNVFTIHIPPLRERRQDIIPLARHFLSTYSVQRHMSFEGFSPEAEELLLNYDFPGNVRELHHMVERAAILQRGSGRIDAKHLFMEPVSGTGINSNPKEVSRDKERRLIQKALEKTSWNRRQAAKNLGIPYSTLRYKMTTLGIR